MCVPPKAVLRPGTFISIFMDKNSFPRVYSLQYNYWIKFNQNLQKLTKLMCKNMQTGSTLQHINVKTFSERYVVNAPLLRSLFRPSVPPSVRPSVYDALQLWAKRGLLQNLFTQPDRAYCMDLVRFVKKKRHENIRNRFAKCGCYVEMRYEKKSRFSTNISLCVGNDTR